MFSDPITITVNAVPKAMPRVLDDTQAGSTYRLADGTFGLNISHNVTKQQRVQSRIRFTQKGIVTNPLDSTNDFDDISISFLVDRPEFGFTQTQIQQMIDGFKTWFDSSAFTKVFAQES